MHSGVLPCCRVCVRHQHGESRALGGGTIARLLAVETSLEISVNREQRDEWVGRRKERREEAPPCAPHGPGDRLSINTAIRAELVSIICLFFFARHIQLIVRRVVYHTPSGSLWEASFTCFVCEFIKHVWRLGPTCARRQHVHVRRCWVSWVNSNLKKLRFEEPWRK